MHGRTDGRTGSRTAEAPEPGPPIKVIQRFPVEAQMQGVGRLPLQVSAAPGALRPPTPRQGQTHPWGGCPSHPGLPELALHSQKHHSTRPRPCTPKQSSQLRIHKEANGCTPAPVAEGAGGENRHGHSSPVSTRSAVQGETGGGRSSHERLYCTLFPATGGSRPPPPPGASVARSGGVLEDHQEPRGPERVFSVTVSPALLLDLCGLCWVPTAAPEGSAWRHTLLDTGRVTGFLALEGGFPWAEASVGKAGAGHTTMPLVLSTEMLTIKGQSTAVTVIVCSENSQIQRH